MNRVYNYCMERTDVAPVEYLEMVYRREFGYTPQELDEIPNAVFLLDLQMMSQEAKAQKAKQDG